MACTYIQNVPNLLKPKNCTLDSLLPLLRRGACAWVQGYEIWKISFTFSDLPNLRCPQYVENLQDYAQSMLGEYDRTAHPNNPARFGKLLLLLPSLRTIRGKVIERLFFRGGIDQLPLDKMLCDMFTTGWFVVVGLSMNLGRLGWGIWYVGDFWWEGKWDFGRFFFSSGQS